MKERFFIVHTCAGKTRWLWKDEKHVKLGFMAFERFLKLSNFRKKTIDYNYFSKSRHYSAFVNFGKYLLDINAIEVEGFIDFLIKSQLKLDDWTLDITYSLWLRELAKKEPAERAVERSILLMEQWSKDTDIPWNHFFKEVNLSTAIRWINNGRISPWILYIAGKPLLDRFNDDHLKLINEAIQPEFWAKKLAIQRKDVQFIKDVLQSVGF